MIEKICEKTGEQFTVSDEEMKLRAKLGIEGEPRYAPVYRLMHLEAFWQHWNLHKRKCGKTGKDIVSVFGPDCDYPVWHKDEWIKHADPPGADFDQTKNIFPQLWEFFRKSPIAHNMGGGNENCEYADDCWYSKNCYLCHSVLECEDVKYCYRILHSNNSQYSVFSNNCELCVDAIYCSNCFNVAYSFLSRQCTDCAFVYDCRNCQNCMFCTNLRNKQYCFGNEQLTREEYENKKREWLLNKRSVYEKAKDTFSQMMQSKGWFRAQMIDQCDNVTGDFLDGCKNCTNCFLMTGPAEDCINSTRQVSCKDTLDCVSAAVNTELAYSCSLAQDSCYMNRFCYNTIQCRFADYSAHCFQCENIFGCCGLVGKKYHIFNKPYPKEQYEILKRKIEVIMKSTGEYDCFFPGYFAANPFDESLANTYWPLNNDDIRKYGFKESQKHEINKAGFAEVSLIPDNCDDADEAISQKVFWDDVAKKPFQIHKADPDFCRRLRVPLPYNQYARRLQENFRLISFTGTLRDVACGKCGADTQTSWPKKYDGRILCESCYLKEVY